MRVPYKIYINSTKESGVKINLQRVNGYTPQELNILEHLNSTNQSDRALGHFLNKTINSADFMFKTLFLIQIQFLFILIFIIER